MRYSSELLVSSKKELSQLFQLNRRIKVIKLRLPALNEAENNKYQNKLNRYHNECGCNTGAFFSITTVAFYILLLIIRTMKTGEFIFGWNILGILFLLFIISAGFGKLIGIMYAKIKYNNIVKEIDGKI